MTLILKDTIKNRCKSGSILIKKIIYNNIMIKLKKKTWRRC